MKKTEVYEATPNELANAIAKEVAKCIMDLKLQPEPLEKPVKTKFIAKFFDVSKQAVAQWCKKNTIPYKKFNGHNYFYMTEVLPYMEDNPKSSVELDVEKCEKYLPNYQK